MAVKPRMRNRKNSPAQDEYGKVIKSQSDESGSPEVIDNRNLCSSHPSPSSSDQEVLPTANLQAASTEELSRSYSGTYCPQDMAAICRQRKRKAGDREGSEARKKPRVERTIERISTNVGGLRCEITNEKGSTADNGYYRRTSFQSWFEPSWSQRMRLDLTNRSSIQGRQYASNNVEKGTSVDSLNCKISFEDSPVKEDNTLLTKDEQELKSKKYIDGMIKKGKAICPNCKAIVQKDGGFGHIVCRCQAELFWLHGLWSKGFI